jgi:PIN domain nuclease of toxin-antitoxin system
LDLSDLVGSESGSRARLASSTLSPFPLGLLARDIEYDFNRALNQSLISAVNLAEVVSKAIDHGGMLEHIS